MHSIQGTRRGTQAKNAIIAVANERRRGVSLIEVMIAAAILVIALIGTSATYVSGRKQIVDQKYYRAAAQLASQKFEELKASGYAVINVGEQEEEISVEGLRYMVQTRIELTATPSVNIPKPCKRATVTISWSLHENDQHEARLVTYIGP